jgi:hypothetical protein
MNNCDADQIQHVESSGNGNVLPLRKKAAFLKKVIGVY